MKNINTSKLISFTKFDLAMLIGAVLTIIISSFTVFAETCEEMPQDVLRLHILANSDSDEDQHLKYQLRDYLLNDFGEVFSSCTSLNEAITEAEKSQEKILLKAQEFLKIKGYDYKVNCEITSMYFTTRVYENITMPAGYYHTVRMTIGSGEGKNWWCVMFPPLCVPAATDEFFTEEQSKVIENGGNVEVKFALFEFLQNIFGGNSQEEGSPEAALSQCVGKTISFD